MYIFDPIYIVNDAIILSVLHPIFYFKKILSVLLSISYCLQNRCLIE